MSKQITIGADIGGGHIMSAAIDTQKHAIIDGTANYQKLNRKGTVEEVMEMWAKSLNLVLKKIDATQVKGITFAMPGPFDYQEGIALFEGNDKYESLKGVKIKDTLSKYLSHQVPMRFMNDATAFAVGEHWSRKGQGCDTLIAITLGTGFGSAFVRDGLPVVKGGAIPEHGCLWHLPFKEGVADDYFSTRWFVNTYNSRSDRTVRSVKEIALLHDESLAQAVFDEFGSNMATFLAPWIRGFAPNLLVVGGNISKAMDRISPSFFATLEKEGLTIELACSELMEDAAVLGSTRLFEEDFWQKIKNDLPGK